MSRLSPLNRPTPRVKIKPGWTYDPVGFAICDGCGFAVMYSDLREKMEYRGGMTPVGTGLRVCGTCDDVPNNYFQLQVLRPDPVPLQNPRPDDSGGVCGAVELQNGSGFMALENSSEFVELQTGDGLLELQDAGLLELQMTDGVVALECENWPQYTTGDLPNPAGFWAGYQIDVMGLADSPVRAYADLINWRRVDTNAVIE